MCDESCFNCKHHLYIKKYGVEFCLKGYDVNDGFCEEYSMVVEDRFKEVVSTQKIIDTVTGKEYEGLIDNELLDLINELNRGYKYV